ncbi:hypothetical protein A2763_01030 [Candidatus Kaiserbacteria bacterium RIFCSPHIGHO2_01_FULL_54_36]|uniref:AB hydrolase-1 domain-containing protein n=1 Tax=Candidatus Kaiserbacteria bacterium RIFCSPHIGHO2_01_FULL_54_36 TaxID=1798482 RepID=A0A1F6CLJ1_9BACT|nr:MAG: hypothetical protein A2763_01030 [Candidatus Kaiserbacteria bacterium RIFCSPHIGHO2_01_FULL_54_36]OGG75795.1 MAG: hypothetical protein A3A41_04090 [Candidatus Kaiserbacteria bacterium RIFCSPLOWO2_01_FULL_54_22]
MNLENSKNPDRRKFLKGVGAVGAAAALGLGASGLLRGDTKQVKIEKRPRAKNMNEAGPDRKKDAYREQFRKREMIDVGNGGFAEVVDVSPENPTEKDPIMLDPSTLVPIDTYEHVIHGFVKAGRRTLGLNHPREGGSTEVPPADRELASKFSPEQVRQALTDIQVLDQKGVERVNALGHSQRGVSSALAALLMVRREKRGEGKRRIKNVVLFESAGLIENDSRSRLARGFVTEPSTRGAWGESFNAMPWSKEDRARVEAENAERAVRGEEPIILPNYSEIVETEEDKEKGASVKRGQFSQYSASPSRAFKEMWGLAATDLLPVLAELKANGVGIIVISGASDTVFPMKKLAGTMDKAELEKPKGERVITPGSLRPENVDMFLPFRGDHALRVPQVPYIEGWLSVMEDKQKRDAVAAGGNN